MNTVGDNGDKMLEEGTIIAHPKCEDIKIVILYGCKTEGNLVNYVGVDDKCGIYILESDREASYISIIHCYDFPALLFSKDNPFGL